MQALSSIPDSKQVFVFINVHTNDALAEDSPISDRGRRAISIDSISDSGQVISLQWIATGLNQRQTLFKFQRCKDARHGLHDSSSPDPTIAPKSMSGYRCVAGLLDHFELPSPANR
jgi:hypothetical protein